MGYYSSKSIQSIETFRLFLRLRITCDTRLTYKIHMWSMNISKSWDNKYIEKANKGNNKITEHRAIFQRERQNS